MDYTLKRNNRSRSIKISLSHDGQVVVSAPRFVPKNIIAAFVNRQIPWIERQQQKLSLKKMANPTFNWDDKIISIYGTLYSIIFAPDQSEKVTLLKGNCMVHPVTGSENDVRKTLLLWLKREAENYILNQVQRSAKIMNTDFGSVRFGQQKSRWGSCTGKNDLSFNWRLIHFPKEVIDYVIVHELAHTKHHNHSASFWELVGAYCPHWKQQRNFLKRQVVLLEK